MQLTLMQMRFLLLAGIFGLSLSAIPSYAQTDASKTRANAVEAWTKLIAIKLAGKTMYPPEAAGQSGTAKVKFVIDRRGKVVSTALVESTGSKLLDAAALMMVLRAEPFPEPPSEVKDDGLSFILPVIFKPNMEPLPSTGDNWPHPKYRDICRGC